MNRDANPSVLHGATAAERALRLAGVRPTRQRLALARLALGHGERHFSAEELFEEAQGLGVGVSLATVYNSLRQFTEVGLLQEIRVDGARVLYDTRTEEHPHFYWEDTGELVDAPNNSVVFAALPTPPAGARIARVDVVVRLRRNSGAVCT